MCGIVGIVGQRDVAAALYDGLTMLQHRGQDAAGIATVDTAARAQGQWPGPRRVRRKAMLLLQGSVGIAPLPLPDRRSRRLDEAQPFYVNSPYGIALAHNGNLINIDELAARCSSRTAATSIPSRTPKCC